MPIKFGNISIPSIYKGTTKIGKIYKGNTLVYQSKLLPDGYTECEYLESTGTQYLDLGYYPNNNTKVETTVNILNHNGSVINYLFGAYDSSRSFAVYCSYNSRDWGVMCGIIDRNTSVAYQQNIKQKVEFDRNNLSINGTSIYTVGSTTTFTSTKTMYLWWGNGTSRLQSISRVYDFKIYENDNLVQYLIPCLDNHSVPCMYDTVSKQTFYNAGTGDFLFKIKKDIIPENYTRCNYLESNGTQYIDTGISCKNAYKWEYDLMQLTAGTANTCVNGAFEQIGTSTSYKRFHNVNNASNQWKFYVGANNLESTYTTVGANTRERISVDVREIPGTVKIKTQTDSMSFGSYDNLTELTFWLFRRNSNYEQWQLQATERIYSFVITNSQNKLVMQMIPCLDNNFRPCLYDTVSKQTFYNLGTGEFDFDVMYYKLPSGYKECEYLQSTGVQYIDTGYYATNTSGINIDYAYTASGNAGLCGIFQSTAPRTDTLFVTTQSGQTSTVIYLISQGGELTNNVVPQIGTKYNAKINYLNNRKLIINNTTTGNDGSNGVVSTRTIKLFCRDNGGSLAYTNARIYECILTTGNTIARYLVPCLDNNGVPCMYDLIGKQTYYNQGEGEFLYKLKDTSEPLNTTLLGFPASNSTQITTNSTYPYSYYFNDVTLELGKTYKMTFYNKRTPSGVDDGTVRFRLLNTDNTFYGAITQNNYSTYWNVQSITTDGNWYGIQEIVFSPKVKTHVLRLLLIAGTNQSCPPNFYLKSFEQL